MEPKPTLDGDFIVGKDPDLRRQTAEVRQPFGLGRLKGWQAYGFTLLVTAATLGLRLAFDGPLGGRPTLVMFTMPIMLSAYVGGLRAGLLATVLTYFGSSYYLLPPIHSFAVASSGDGWQLFFVVLAGVFISILNEALHRSRRRADVATREHQQAEEDRQRFFTLSQDVLCILGFDGYFKDVNPAWEKTLDYTRAELLTTPFIEFVHPDDQKATLAEAEKVSGGRSLMAFENRYRCKDGSYRLFQWSVTPVTEDRVMYGVARDITERKQAEEARRESEARYLTLFENAPDGIVIADREGRYLDANPAICRMLGYSREEMVARSVVDVVILEEISHIAPAFAEVDAGTDHHREWQFRHKDGSVFAAEVIATQVPNGLVMGMVRDITERKRIEARMRRLVDSNVQGVMFWNRKGQIHKANDAFLHTVGYTHEDLEAGRIDWTKMTPSEYADLDRHALEEIAAKGVCTPFEKEYTCKDGSRVPVMIGAAAFEDSPDEGVCFMLDITERRRTEQALRDSEEHFRFLNNLSEATRTLADPARIMAVTARMLGEHLHASRCAYADVEQDGELFTILHDYTDDCQSTVGIYQLSLFGTRAVATLHAGQTLIIRNLEAELSAGDGADMFNAIGIKAIITCPLVKDGGLRAMMAVHQTAPRDWEPGEIAIVQDVVERCWATIERRTAEEKVHLLNAELEQRVTERTAQLEAVNKELEEFAYAASHDLKAPLRVIDNASKWLEEDLREHLTVETRENMNLMRGRVQRMEKLLDDLLDYSRIGRTVDDRYAEVITADVLVENILALLSPPEAFTIKVGPNLAGIRVRRMPLQQILMNLISNAIKHHDKKAGCVEVTGEDHDLHYAFAVKDDGPGIPAQFHDHVFKMFQTLKPRDQVEGSGMGLAMVRKNIGVFGGTLTLESSDGHGSVFRFTWPKQQKPMRGDA